MKLSLAASLALTIFIPRLPFSRECTPDYHYCGSVLNEISTAARVYILAGVPFADT